MFLDRSYEFRPFDSDGNELPTKHGSFKSESAAKSFAGRISKENGGPCDLAYASSNFSRPTEWGDRYITTAAPSQYHAKGFRLERLS